MTSYKVVYRNDAIRFLKNNKAIGVRFIKAFTELSEKHLDTFCGYDIKRLKGYEDMYRLRIGKYRAVYRVKNDKLLILVVNIGSRGDIYKQIS